MEKKYLKIKLFLDKRELGIVQPQGTYLTENYSDYYININLTREIKMIDEYIDVQKDPLRMEMSRQLINPWFMEFGFFETIKRTGITGKTDDPTIIYKPQEQIITKAKNFSIDINK